MFIVGATEYATVIDSFGPSCIVLSVDVKATMLPAVKLLEVSAVLSDGISGGPIINDRHQVVGIAHKGGNLEQKQYAIEVSELLKLASE